MTAVQSAVAAPSRARAGVKSFGAVRFWLFAVPVLIFAMVVVGGATRLTESGLSITEWKPITGILPPLTADDWLTAFAEYKKIPQYSQLFPDMTLSAFKTIYFWEWSHRLLARIIGAAFIAPLLFFWATGRLRGIGLQMIVPTLLLALEPAVGWWMVASGLSERVEVSQVRLAIHLLIATATFGALLWIAVGLSERRRDAASRGLKWASGLIALLIFCQIGFGALVAGLRAGRIDNTWPLMEGRLIPASLYPTDPWWGSMFEDATTAQFQHRMLAYAIVVIALGHAVATVRWLPRSRLTQRAAAVAILALAQAAVGIVTLLLVVPIPAGLAHQALAMALFGMAVVHWRATALG